MTQYPEAYISYLCYFHGERDYFECHEVMEEFWKEHPDDPRKPTYVGLIQIAVGLYHSRRGNVAGAVKMLRSALRNLKHEDVHSLGLQDEELRDRISQVIEAIEGENYQFKDMNLPIVDDELIEACLAICAEQGLTWEAPSQMDNEMLTLKHTRRDRTEVIEERARQQAMRKAGGSSK
ncbi:DUF309 domain-containing protein [Paenibacillus roseipurpureus]|uniref:DUF309 domain-containing protein n=1 Tax=Paenibacillus roseopurpureus TaxID=2918901 RepID=A0AA96LJR9_9BACL|nr:DUF309 domain-containing protein [Paenibacillus sp. MBLB1832]WNR42316.1 DUF309 domain-containing protein [Paenibacillus sp. MBLB1832]